MEIATVNRLVCEDCGTVYYSAAARTLIDRGERCSNCGGRLVHANGPRPVGGGDAEGPQPTGGGSRRGRAA
jgi:DNA-directed RNA polymerase subunit RPC12/RpoP